MILLKTTLNKFNHKFREGGVAPDQGRAPQAIPGPHHLLQPPPTKMTIPLLAPVLLTIMAFYISRITPKAPEVKRKEDTTKDPKSLTLYQDYLKQQGLTGNPTGTIVPVALSRIRTSYGEATASLVHKHLANNKGTKDAKKSQTLSNNRMNNRYTMDEDSRTSFYDLDFALAVDYVMNTSRPNNSDVQSNHDHDSHDSGCHDYGSHDCGGHDFGGFDCGSD